jgi:flagellar motility protein MotE (MotC chaperone)
MTLSSAKALLFPTLIFACVLMLGGRLLDLRQAVQDMRVPTAGAPSLAEDTTHQGTDVLPEDQPKLPEASEPVAPKKAPSVGLDRVSSSTSTDTSDSIDRALEDGDLSQAQYQVLQSLGARRQELEKRSKDLDQREALMTITEKRIDGKLAELQALRGELQKMVDGEKAKSQAQLDSMVKIYETMKPKEAARIFETLDLPVLLGVIQRMKEARSAPILAAMDPEKAKSVTTALLQKKEIPGDTAQ